jgi:hypothetical protein
VCILKFCFLDPSITQIPTDPNMVHLSQGADTGSNWTQPHHDQKTNQQNFRQQQRSSFDDRRLSLDTVPVKLIAPVTVVKSANGSGSPFKISENSAFTPIQPRREASVERRPPPMLTVTTGSLHAQSVPDVSAAESKPHTGAANASNSSVMSIASNNSAQNQGPIQITVVMRPTSGGGSGSGQQQASQKVSPFCICVCLCTYYLHFRFSVSGL